MARTPDPHLKRELLDQVVAYLAENGLAQTTLRPMAGALGVSINRLMHHFGSKDELITAALARAIDLQIDVQRKWLHRSPRPCPIRRWPNPARRCGSVASSVESWPTTRESLRWRK